MADAVSSPSSAARPSAALLVLGLLVLAIVLRTSEWQAGTAIGRMAPLVATATAVGLMFVVATRTFSTAATGLLAAGFLVSMPMVWLAARASSDGLLTLPLVVGWLLSCRRFSETSDRIWIWAAGSSLGLGLYTHPAALVMMPAFVVISIAALASSPAIPRRLVLELAGAFGVTAIPLAVFLVTHPEYIRMHVIANGLYDAQRFSPLQGLREMSSWVGLTARSEVYWDYFNPAFLFLSGRTITGSVLRPQVLLLPFAVLLPAGLYRVASGKSVMNTWLLVGGLAVSPLAAALNARPPSPERMLIAAPFIALICTHGVVELVTSQRRAVRLSGMAIIVAVIVTGAAFVRWG
ncbi:MAG: hypothetical protein ACRD2N_18820 [Vicinamibacterales bacterium]